MNPITIVAAVIGKVFDRVLPDREKSREAQARLNEQEVAGAPPSIFRLWRSIFFMSCTLAFIWEIIIRPVVVTYWPNTMLPPSMLNEVMRMLLAGLGF